MLFRKLRTVTGSSIATFSSVTHVTHAMTQGRGDFKIHAEEGAFELTPASKASIAAVGQYMDDLNGIGLDWGTGAGALGILCASRSQVDRVYGLDIEEANIRSAEQNALLNNVVDKTRWFLADSFQPIFYEHQQEMSDLEGEVDFVVANPPASIGDDGWNFRRRILTEAPTYLKPGGLLLMQWLSYYGTDRAIAHLEQEGNKVEYQHLAYSTDWTHLDTQSDLLNTQLRMYAAEEKRGGLRYYCHPRDEAGKDLMTAVETLQFVEETGNMPLCKWQVHLFKMV